jgi:hypothetical protein
MENACVTSDVDRYVVMADLGRAHCRDHDLSLGTGSAEAVH